MCTVTTQLAERNVMQTPRIHDLDAIRKRLLEMIVKNETRRRIKPR